VANADDQQLTAATASGGWQTRPTACRCSCHLTCPPQSRWPAANLEHRVHPGRGNHAAANAGTVNGSTATYPTPSRYHRHRASGHVGVKESLILARRRRLRPLPGISTWRWPARQHQRGAIDIDNAGSTVATIDAPRSPTPRRRGSFVCLNAAGQRSHSASTQVAGLRQVERFCTVDPTAYFFLRPTGACSTKGHHDGGLLHQRSRRRLLGRRDSALGRALRALERWLHAGGCPDHQRPAQPARGVPLGLCHGERVPPVSCLQQHRRHLETYDGTDSWTTRRRLLLHATTSAVVPSSGI